MKKIYLLIVFIALALFAKAAFVDNVSAKTATANGVANQRIETGDDLAPEVSSTIVISQAYGGGGGTTGTYLFDYVELKNVSAVVQSLNGLSLMYGSATGQFGSVATNVFALPNASINPGQYYLVQLSTTGTAGVALPVAPDATSTNLSMSGTSGKVALVTSAFVANTCGATATPCTLPNTQIVDLVAWGASNNAEGSGPTNAAAALTATQGNVRKGGGCTDVDNNNADFDVVTAPVPRNTATTPSICTAVTPIRLFTARLNSASEVPTNASTATGYGRVVLNAAENQITASFYWSGLGGNTTAGHIHTGAVGISGPVLFNMAPPTGATFGKKEDMTFAITPAQVADMRAGLFYFNVHTTTFGGGEIRGQIFPGRQRVPADYNGDGKTDYALVRQDGINAGRFGWFIRMNGSNASSGTDFGLNSDYLTLGDFDGDGKDDIAIWRSGSGLGTNNDTSGFYIFRSSDSTYSYTRFGQANDDVTVVADYTGDGKDDLAVYRAGNPAAAGQLQNRSTFWFLASSGPRINQQVAVSWGLGDTSVGPLTGDKAYPGDFNGDGIADFCVYRPQGTTAVFITAFSTGDGGGNFSGVYQPFGKATDDFYPGDYDGDGKTDLATARGEGTRLNWYYLSSKNGALSATFWGLASGDTPCQGDYDGDGKTDFAVFRANNSTNPSSYFFYFGSTSGPSISPAWGSAGDIPIANDFH